MSDDNLNLPSNRKFGFFFTFVFAVAAVYSFSSTNMTWSYAFITMSMSFLVFSFVKSSALLPLNKLWMLFGIFLGNIISPIILGIIFFGIFTPYSIIMKIMGRDELRLKRINNISYWIIRSKSSPQTDFKKQF